jgi:SAM-dependent methyltransferase
VALNHASTRYTYDFVRQSLPRTTRDILEIGCGDGTLAARLSDDGFRVRAVDSDEDCVAKARAAGVDARLATWPETVDRHFDAILFTRSLHHVEKLEAGVAAARRALQPGGCMIVEDFRSEAQDDVGRRWCIDTARQLQRKGKCADTLNIDELDLRLGDGARDHDLHPSHTIQAILTRAGMIEASNAAYYFRYLEPYLTIADAETLLGEELALIAEGTIDPLGKRFVVQN